MEIVKVVQDQYNPIKTWAVTKTKCRHYGVIQYVNGLETGRSARFGLRNLKTLLEIDN